jgi:phospholipid/cholesterol/gamma-HCH transport system substrate-binding protein
LLGGKFVQLQPGHSAKMMAENGILEHTTTYKSIEQMVGDLIFLATADNGTAKGAAGSPAAPGGGVPSPSIPSLNGTAK